MASVDLFLVCDEDNTGDQYFQIWVNNKDDGFALAQLGRLPRGTQSISFADVGERVRPRRQTKSTNVYLR